jgi:putative ABC transport system permease protein
MSMRFTYTTKLAFRNIWAHKLRSVLTILGIAIGVGFIIFLVSMGYGLQRISTSQIANIQALQVIDVAPGKSKVVRIDDTTIDKFRNLSNVQQVSPVLDVVGNISYGTSTIEGVIYGKNIDYLKLEEDETSAGSLYTNNQDKKVLINQTAANQLKVGSQSVIGKTITLKMAIPADYMKKDTTTAQLKEEKFVVVGVLKNEGSPYVYIPLEQFKMLGVTHYSGAKIKVNNKTSVDMTKKQLENIGFKATTLKDTVDQINQFFQVFQLILLSFGIIAVVVAAIGMFNTLTISLLEKTREISFMKVMGTTKADIWKLFFSEALIIGVVGAAFGILCGMLIGNSINAFLVDLAQKTGNKPVQIFYTPIYVIFVTFISAATVSFLTGIYPSFRATRIDPLESMRYE